MCASDLARFAVCRWMTEHWSKNTDLVLYASERTNITAGIEIEKEGGDVAGVFLPSVRCLDSREDWWVSRSPAAHVPAELAFFSRLIRQVEGLHANSARRLLSTSRENLLCQLLSGSVYR